MLAANERIGTVPGIISGKERIPHPLRTTAIHYLKEALKEERYEEMADMVSIAREFGADVWEIRLALSKESNR